MEKVTRFTSEDGAEWKTRSEALERDCTIDFVGWYEHDNAPEHGDLDPSYFITWLYDNYDKMHEVMKKLAAIKRRKALEEKKDLSKVQK